MSATLILQRAVVLDAISMSGYAGAVPELDFSAVQAQVSHLDIRAMTTDQALPAAIANSEVVICNKVKFNRQIFQQHPQLKLLCLTATGTNNVDLVAARDAGVVVCNVVAYATASVVQHVFALLLALTTRLPELRVAMDQGEWTRSAYFSLLQFPVRELPGKTLGIIGYGELGQQVAQVAQCFGMRILVAKRDAQDQRPNRMALHELLPQVDVLSVHCPLTDDTRNLIAERELALMKSDALLINTARGGIVNELALLHALQTKKIAGAALDVLSVEPPPADHVLLQYKQPNLIITPHVAWASREARQRCLDETALNIAAFKCGESRNRV